MVWCGFDDRMRLGIVQYADGVARAIRTKARESSVSVGQQLARERAELKTLEELILERLSANSDSEAVALQLRAFVGMVSIARLLIESPDASSEIDSGFGGTAYDLGTLIREFDEHYATLPVANDHPTNASTSLSTVIPKKSLITAG